MLEAWFPIRANYRQRSAQGWARSGLMRAARQGADGGRHDRESAAAFFAVARLAWWTSSAPARGDMMDLLFYRRARCEARREKPRRY